MIDSRKIPDDEIFAIHITSNMEIRNIMRSGLVQAQNNNTDKIPIFVSWPEWLEDGIVCLYANDFHNVLGKAIRDTAIAVSTACGITEEEFDIEKVEKSIKPATWIKPDLQDIPEEPSENEQEAKQVDKSESPDEPSDIDTSLAIEPEKPKKEEDVSPAEPQNADEQENTSDMEQPVREEESEEPEIEHSD
jgi:hypothetical protein